MTDKTRDRIIAVVFVAVCVSPFVIASLMTQEQRIAADRIFDEQVKAFAQFGKIRTLASNGKVYWCGVRLVA